MAVCQGEDMGDLITTYQTLVDLGYTHIAFNHSSCAYQEMYPTFSGVAPGTGDGGGAPADNAAAAAASTASIFTILSCTCFNSTFKSLQFFWVAVCSSFLVFTSSPFLRCIQTALKIKPNTKIYIDYGLSELISDYEYNLTNGNFDIEALYQHSLTKLTEEEKSYLQVLNRTPIIIQNESDPDYNKRIIDTVNRINDTYTNKNILLVSHAYSSGAYLKPDLKYSEVVKIVSGVPGPVPGGGACDDKKYEMKYLKYKMKYLELKKLK